jgi:hypothetical protein
MRVGYRAMWAVWAIAGCGVELEGGDSADGVVWIEGVDPGAEPLPTGAAGPPPLAAGYLEFGVNTLDQGETVQMKVRGADPGDTVTFLRATGYGQGNCPRQIAPTCLQLTGPVDVVGQEIANASGVATLSFVMPNRALGAEVAFQAVVGGGSPKTSEVQIREVRPQGSTDRWGAGATYELFSLAMVSPDAILAHTVEITESAEVDGFACRSRMAGGRFKAALYEDNNGAPGLKIAESDPESLVVGVSRARNITPNATAQPGRYWLATTFERGLDTWSNGLMWNHPEWIILQPFSSAMPTNWRGGNFYQSPRIDCFVSLR